MEFNDDLQQEFYEINNAKKFILINEFQNINLKLKTSPL